MRLAGETFGEEVRNFGCRSCPAGAIGQNGNAELHARCVADVCQSAAAAVAKEGEIAEPLDDHREAVAFALGIAAEAVEAVRGERDIAQARSLLDLVESRISGEWREIGRVRLLIEQNIVRAGQ